jgi:acetyl esterase/lipase
VKRGMRTNVIFLLLCCGSLTHASGAVRAEANAACWTPRNTGAPGYSVLAQNVPYQEKPNAQKLDIYVPGTSPAPYKTVILLHGGCFQIGSKNSAEVMTQIQRITNAGYAVISVDYRLVQANKPDKNRNYPAPWEDVQDAVRFVRSKDWWCLEFQPGLRLVLIWELASSMARHPSRA